MNKFKELLNDAKMFASKHSPEILTGLGIAGMITTTVLAVKATPKALDLLKEAEREKGEELTPVETVKTVWKEYAPAAITCAVSTGCLIGSVQVNTRRNAALATAYQLSSTALSEYREKVVETIGEKKEKEIKEKIAQDKVDKKPASTSEVIVMGGGGVLFLEPVSMRYFTSDVETVRKAINDINFRLTTGMEEYISLSELYDEFGLSHTATSDDVGWNLGRDGQIRVDMPLATTDDGKPCFMLDYHVAPRWDFHKLS